MVPTPDRPNPLAAIALDPIPFVRCLGPLMLAAILAQTGRASGRIRRLPAESVIWLVIAMALFAAASIPKAGTASIPVAMSPSPTIRPLPRPTNDSASPRFVTSSFK